VQLHSASLESYPSLHNVLARVQPDECYHLGAQSFVSYSFDDEFSTFMPTSMEHIIYWLH